jgi:hypothetical protein
MAQADVLTPAGEVRTRQGTFPVCESVADDAGGCAKHRLELAGLEPPPSWVR